MSDQQPLADRLHSALRASRHQGGFVSAAELQRHGFSRSGISRLIERRMLERVALGWYRSTLLPWTHDDRVRQAALLVEPDGALASTSALHWRGIGQRPETICLIVHRDRRPRPGQRKLMQSTDLVPVDVVVHRSLRVTTPARSLIDAARFNSVEQLNRLISSTVETGLTTESQVALRFLELARAGRPGVTTMRAALATRTDLVGPTATTFEQDFERIVNRGRFPKPIRQHRVTGPGWSYRVDHAWPTFGCWAECDSLLAHSSPEQLAADLERQNRLIAATGWRPVRFTYRDVHDRPDYVIDCLAEILPTPSKSPPRSRL